MWPSSTKCARATNTSPRTPFPTVLATLVFDYPISLDLCTTLFTGSFVKDIRRMLAPKDIDRFDAPSGLARFELRAVQMRLLP